MRRGGKGSEKAVEGRGKGSEKAVRSGGVKAVGRQWKGEERQEGSGRARKGSEKAVGVEGERQWTRPHVHQLARL